MADSKIFTEPTAEETALLKQMGSADLNQAMAAGAQLATAMTEPLRETKLAGDLVTEMFETVPMPPGAAPEFPLDLIAPGEENDIVAFTIPKQGRIPDREVESDYVTVPYFGVANSIDWQLRYAEDARWDITGRAMQVYQAGFVKKKNDDCAHVIIASAVDRNIIVYDSDASAGQFTKRLVSLMKTTERRNGGGNSSSVNRFTITDLILSPEAVEDMRDWKVDQVDEVTRREIYVAPDGGLNRIFNVNLRDWDEFGESQEYQNYFTDTLGGSLASGDVELVIGLDLSRRGTLLQPLRTPIQTFPDPALHRRQKAGFYGWTWYGVGCTDERVVLAGSF